MDRCQADVVGLFSGLSCGGRFLCGKALDGLMNYLLKSPAHTREGHTMLEIITNVLALVLLLFNSFGTCGVAKAADDPMNKPLDSLGVFDYDRGLCNDRWNTCGEYERKSFGSKYPGRSISELGLYDEAKPYREPSRPTRDYSSDKAEERWVHETARWASEEYRKRFEGD